MSMSTMRQAPWRIRVQIPYLSDFLRGLVTSSRVCRLRSLYNAVHQIIDAIRQLAREILKGHIRLSKYTLLKLNSDRRDRRVLRAISRTTSIKVRRQMMRRHYHQTRFWKGLHTAYHHCVKNHLQHGRWLV